MVDASLRMSIVNLFNDLRDELGISIIYITHDLATAYYHQRPASSSCRRARSWRRATPAPCSPPRQHPYSRQLKDAVLLPDAAQGAAPT